MSLPIQDQAVLIRESKEATLNRKPRQAPDIVEYEMDGEVTLFDPKNDKVHMLNQMAAVIWRLCGDSRTAEQMVEDVVGLFDVDSGMVRSDVGQLLAQLEEAMLIEVAA